MCVNPKRIWNRGKFFRPGVDKASFFVPCGKCPECHRKITDEWFLRTVREVEQCNKEGGKVVFTTLTYNDSCLPHFDNKITNPSCFSYKDQHRFIRSMTKFFERHCVGFDNKKDFRYIIFPERGSDDFYVDEHGRNRQATLRPHYHILLMYSKKAFDSIMISFFNSSKVFLNMPVTRRDLMFNTLAEPVVKSFVENYWKVRVKREVFVPYKRPKLGVLGKYKKKAFDIPLGSVRWSDRPKKCKSGIFVDGEEASLYASKYACKDLSFYESEDVKNFLSDENGDLSPEKLHKYKGCLPRHHQSNFFGFDLVHELGDFDNDGKFIPNENYERYLLEGKDFGFSVDFEKLVAKKHKFPQYILNKINKTKKYVDGFEDPLPSYNRHYVLYLKHSLSYKIKECEQLFEKRLSIGELSKYLKSYNSNLTPGQFLDEVSQIMRGRKLYDLAVYNVVFKDLSLPGKMIDVLESMPYETIIDTGMDMALQRFEGRDFNFAYYHPDGWFSDECHRDIHEREFRYFDTLSCFIGFDGLIEKINKVYGEYRHACQMKFLKDNKERKAQKRAMYNFKHKIF